jgi:hypothetical protein
MPSTRRSSWHLTRPPPLRAVRVMAAAADPAAAATSSCSAASSGPPPCVGRCTPGPLGNQLLALLCNRYNNAGCPNPNEVLLSCRRSASTLARQHALL